MAEASSTTARSLSTRADRGLRTEPISIPCFFRIAHCIGPDFALYSGNDDITVPLMSIGGSGVISVYANVMPAMCHQIVADYLSGNQAQAVANHLRYLRVMNDLFIEVNPIPVKAAMNMMGLNVGPMRLPLCEMSAEHSAVLRASLEEAGLL